MDEDLRELERKVRYAGMASSPGLAEAYAEQQERWHNKFLEAGMDADPELKERFLGAQERAGNFVIREQPDSYVFANIGLNGTPVRIELAKDYIDGGASHNLDEFLAMPDWKPISTYTMFSLISTLRKHEHGTQNKLIGQISLFIKTAYRATIDESPNVVMSTRILQDQLTHIDVNLLKPIERPDDRYQFTLMDPESTINRPALQLDAFGLLYLKALFGTDDLSCLHETFQPYGNGHSIAITIPAIREANHGVVLTTDSPLHDFARYAPHFAPCRTTAKGKAVGVRILQ